MRRTVWVIRRVIYGETAGDIRFVDSLRYDSNNSICGHCLVAIYIRTENVFLLFNEIYYCP